MKVSTTKRLETVQEYYFSRKLKEIAQMQADGKEIINLGIGSPDLPPPPAVIQTLANSAEGQLANKYQSYVGIPNLREAIATWYSKNYSVQLNPKDEILPLIGSKEGIMHLSMSFLESGDEVLVPNPGYPTYTAAAKLAGATILEYKLLEENAWEPDFETLESQDLSNVKIMWVNYPHMPSGKAASPALFEKLIAFGKSHNILICHDNPYSFVRNENRLSILSIEGAKDCAIELNSLSKSHHMAGWRVGMMVGKNDFIQSALKFKSNMDSGMYRPIQEAAITALQTSDNWHDAQNKIYRKRAIIAQEILESIGCTVNADQVGMFLWGKLNNQYLKKGDGFIHSDIILNQTGVFITPGGIFGDAGNQYLRISLCSSEEILNKAKSLIQTKINQS